MAGPYFLLYLGKRKEAWYRLSQKEKDDLMAKHNERFEAIGGEDVVACDSSWSSEQWMFFGVHKFADIEAVHKHSEFLLELDWHRYFDSMTVLGTEWSPP